jgi:hypothetical protein
VKTRKILSLEKIAERLEEYDTAVTVEPSLADALNERLEDEKVFTPREFVDAGNFRKELFLEIVDETDLTWKQASYLLDSILECWKYKGEKQEILEYENFDSEGTRKILEILDEKETPYDSMEEFELEGEIAVLKLHQFTAIDRKVLPENYDQIPVFSDEENELPEFSIFDSASEIARAVKQQVEKLGPENVGVAVKPGSRYEPVLKSMLESGGIDYRKTRDLKSDEEFRTFLSVLEAGIREKKVRVRDVRPIVEHLGLKVSRRHENRRFENISQAEELKEFLNVVPYLDYREAARKYLEMTDDHVHIESVLEEIGILEEQVSEERNTALRYYVENFPVGLEENDGGVLLADPTEVSHIDREYVFHFGMDNDWRQKEPERPWIEDTEKAHLKDFKSLIQSGEENYFLVRESEMNEEITPCLYFNSIFEDYKSFSDLPHSYVRPEQEEREEGFEKTDVKIESEDIETGEIETVSQAELNSFAMSPRLYYIQQLVSESDQVKFEKGNLFHDYAEFHANNPGKAEELSIEEIVEFMTSRIEDLADEEELEELETEFRIGIENIRSFLSEKKVSERPLDGYKVKEEENTFIEEFGGGNRSHFTEPYIKDEDLGIKGKVDLVLGENHLVDYKSGRKKSRRKVMKKSHVELHEEEKFPDFQPLMYITYHRKFHPGATKFTFLHFLNDLGDAVNGEEAETETTIKYYPRKFSEKKASMEIFEKLIKDVAKSNDRRKTLEKLGFQNYSDFMKEYRARFFDKDDILGSDLREEFEEYAKQRVGDYKYVEKGVEKTLKKLVDIRLENYFREDADQMEEFLQEKLGEINEYRESRFPVDANPDELPMRDMILR